MFTFLLYTCLPKLLDLSNLRGRRHTEAVSDLTASVTSGRQVLTAWMSWYVQGRLSVLFIPILTLEFANFHPLLDAGPVQQHDCLHAPDPANPLSRWQSLLRILLLQERKWRRSKFHLSISFRGLLRSDVCLDV